MDIGFIGLGKMGFPMARRLIEAKNQLTVFDTRKEVVDQLVKLGALVFILYVPMTYAIQLQLLGGIWIIQTLPAVLLGLYTRWLNPRALLVGWALGIASGTAMAGASGFKASVYVLHFGSVAIPCYAALSSLLLNVIASTALSFVFNAILTPRPDMTVAEDYA